MDIIKGNEWNALQGYTNVFLAYVFSGYKGIENVLRGRTLMVLTRAWQGYRTWEHAYKLFLRTFSMGTWA